MAFVAGNQDDGAGFGGGAYFVEALLVDFEPVVDPVPDQALDGAEYFEHQEAWFGRDFVELGKCAFANLFFGDVFSPGDLLDGLHDFGAKHEFFVDGFAGYAGGAEDDLAFLADVFVEAVAQEFGGVGAAGVGVFADEFLEVDAGGNLDHGLAKFEEGLPDGLDVIEGFSKESGGLHGSEDVV